MSSTPEHSHNGASPVPGMGGGPGDGSPVVGQTSPVGHPHMMNRYAGSRCHTHQLNSVSTTLQYVMNAKLSKHRFWHCHENGLIKTIQTIPHNLHVSFKLTSLYCGLRIILVYPNPQ